MIESVISHYRIIEKLGQGGMGVVYKAEDSKLNRPVALKFLPPDLTRDKEANRRFVYEAQTASALDHQNITTIYEIDESDDGRLFICMAYYEGLTLKQMIAQGPLQIEQALDITIQIGQGLAKAHEKGIIHRDIKPANIIVQGDGTVKIIDFGLSKLAGVQNITKSGSTMGTVAYMSGEQALGKKVDHRSDIWSLGVVLYEMLTGQQPFQAKYDETVVYNIINKEPKPVTALCAEAPVELEMIVNKALSKKVENRYQQMNDLLTDLHHLKENPADVSAKAATTKRPAILLKTKWTGLGMIGIFLVLIIWFTSQWVIKNESPSLTATQKSIAVMYFDNHSGEPDLEKILVDMLTTNLARYDDLNVVSSQRLFDILKNMGKLDKLTIDRTVATEVAQRAGVETMMLGSIIHLGDNLRITSQLIDVQTGSVVASLQADGARVEDVFAMVDDLTEQVSAGMEVVAAESEAEPFKITQVTTQSFEAYKYYQKGLEASWRKEFATALQNWERAVTLDSTFAMALTYLAYQRGWRGLARPAWDLSARRRSLELAEKYSRRASHKERLFILAIQAAMNRDFQSSEALFVDYVNRYPMERNVAIELYNIARINGNIDRQIWAIERVLEWDPTFAAAYNILAYIYAAQNKHAKAISANKKYRALEPDIIHPYYAAGEIYMQAGQFDEALRISEQALQKNPEWYKLYRHIGHINLYRGARDKARDYLHRLRWSSISKLRMMGWTYVYEGRFEKAAEQFRNAADQALRVQKTPYDAVSALLDLGKLRTVQGKHKKALAAFKEAVQISGRLDEENNVQIWTEYLAGSALVKKEATREAQARALKIKEMVEQEHYDRFYLNYYHLLLAEIYLAKGDGQAALAVLNNYNIAALYSPRFRTLQAASHALLGHHDEAIKQYKEFYSFTPARYNAMGGDRFDYYYEHSRVNYHLARIYEQIGDTSQVVVYYSKFLDLWENADPELPELIDAKSRYAHLKDEIKE